MSSIDEMIAQMEKEDELSRQEEEKLFTEQEKKYTAMYKRLVLCREESKKNIDSIVKNLDQLIANKHTIDKALEQSENLPGLPVPYEHHASVIDMFSKITTFVNKAADTLSKKNTFSPQQIQSESVFVTESVSEDLKHCKMEVSQAQSLSSKVKVLKKLIDESNANNEEVAEDENVHDGSFVNADHTLTNQVD